MSDEVSKVLCVDDELDILEVLKLSLEASGLFAVETCGSAVEAFERAQLFRPDLFILDVMMPDIDGMACLHRIRNCPGWENTPVIFLTTRCGPDDVEEYRKLGAIGVIAKPFDPFDLPHQVTDVWQNVQPQTCRDS